MTPWEIKGRERVNCTCEYGCNCQFNALPDKGHCHAVAGIVFDEGHFGDVRLDGLRVAAIFKWPGAIHEGNGEAIAFVDERANDAQREALLKIMTGQDTDPFATMFAVYASTVTTMHPPVFTPIELDVDVAGLYPDSIAETSDGLIYVGARRYLVQVDTHARTTRWYTRADCPRFRLNDAEVPTCQCR